MLARLAGRTRASQASARGQRGQVLILFVMGATVIFVIGAIVVDIGLWVSERRNAQAAADLAALAAATQLHNADPFGDATAKAIDFAKRNGYDIDDPKVEVHVGVAFNGDPDQVEVEISEHGGSLFGGIFGIASMDIGATAVAAYGNSPPGPDAALFASSSVCNAGQTLDIQAQHLDVTGSTHSNGTIHIEGPDDNFFGPVTWACPNGFSESPQQNGFYQSRRMTSNQTPPLDLKWTDIEPHCDGITLGNLVISDLAPWQDKVVCATGDLTLNVNATQGRVTLAAQGRVLMLGAANQLQPSTHLASSGFDQLLVYSSSAGLPAIGITATAGEYTGYIHAPNSRVEFNGLQDVRVNGAIVAKTVLVSGSNMNFTALVGLPGPPGPPQVHLED